MQVYHFDTIMQLSDGVAGDIVKLARAAVAEKGYFSIVFTGGKTPAFLYELLGSSPFVEKMPWQQTHVFWGDERCVPPTDPASNYKLAFDTLLHKGLVPAANIHRMEGEDASPALAAQRYQQEIELFFKDRAAGKPGSGFDLILLGMGPDGHVASLFPTTPLLSEKRMVVACDGLQGNPVVPRVTLSLSAINQAQNIFMLISGNDKKKIFEEINNNKPGVEVNYPAALVKPKGLLNWYIAK
ncbi:MAG: 6-phosphogluconolactonase [Desulfobulbaceae bacterium]|nr:6-phosphogluconolactonase [Desulfobulbaceae bacterium]HIJ79814.1 6-phosphogluconolactonase [Deltaproteobacteria bacterium]